MSSSLVACLTDTFNQFTSRSNVLTMPVGELIITPADPRRVYMAIWIDSFGSAFVGPDTMLEDDRYWLVDSSGNRHEWWIEKHKALVQRQFKAVASVAGFIHVYEELYTG